MSEEEWSDDWPEEVVCVAALLDPSRTFESVEAALEDDRVRGFDLRQAIRGSDFYDAVRIVNYARSRAPIDAAALRAELEEGNAWRDDGFLRPVIPGDPVLSSLEDEDYDEDAERRLPEAAVVRRALEFGEVGGGLRELAARDPPEAGPEEEETDTPRTRMRKREAKRRVDDLIALIRQAQELL